MNTLVSDGVDTRRAAKLVLIVEKDGQDGVLTLQGKSRMSLPGGGVDLGESDLEALLREVDEEVGRKLSTKLGSLTLTHAGGFYGLVSSSKGARFVADWQVFTARIDRDSLPDIETGDGVVEHKILPVHEAIAHPKMSELAVEAILRAVETHRQITAETSADLN